MGFESLHGSPHAHLPPPDAVAPFHRLLASLGPDAPPTARLACGPALQRAHRLVALPGSFNPPHRAHTALLDAARRAVGAEAAAFVLSARTVDKEQVSGMWLEDRLWLLCRAADAVAAPSVVVTNRGLYVEQALALRALCPQLKTLTFVTGYDKIVQIFDARYYDDRDAALDELFSHAEFLVAPRGEATARDLAALLALPENVRYAPKVGSLAVEPSLAEVSSTRARAQVGLDDVDDSVRSFVRESGCYLNPVPESYAARGAAIRAAAAEPA
ncbi:MAG TPA: hypothetical protein VFX49_17200 [Chloroflexota bacterium]|nr:hypothetical protein [Chloroflexota bacterium]